MLTDQRVIGLFVDLILVAVPISHTAFVIAVLLRFATAGLRNRLSTVMAKNQVSLRRMPMQIGFDGIGGKVKRLRDPLITHTNSGIEIDLIHGFVCHRMSPF